MFKASYGCAVALLSLCGCSLSGLPIPGGLRIDSSTPGVIQANDSGVAWTLDGAGFEPGTTVTTTYTGVTITGATYVSGARMTFSLSADATTATGIALIVVTNPDNTTTAHAVTVLPAVVLLGALVQPILTPRCATSGCHTGATPAAGLDLASGKTFAATVNVASSQVGSLSLVDPANPDASYLVDKLEGTHTVGERMPQGGSPLSATELFIVRKWIEAGALNN